MKQRFGNMIQENLPLAAHTTFRIGGAARLAGFPTSEEELSAMLLAAKEEAIPYRVVGRGSNLLFDDSGYDGLVLFTAQMKRVVWDEGGVWADAGVSLTALAIEAAKRGLAGLEFAYGIPASVGGAVYMNAGAYNAQISDVLTYSRYLTKDGKILTRTSAEHGFGYRKCVYQKTGEIVLGAYFALKKGDATELRTVCEKRMASRREKQPLEFPSAGSVFKRPFGSFAGALIENAGLKGYRIGGAEVSEKHAGFIINRGGATASDVLALIAHIRAEVLERYGVLLKTEIIYIENPAHI
ncbi:MAG: UDP-N-acetylmuramate dehydrogenase [Clostridia bacterium]|nr:UDP-N-acetylmuramate dehydrogenase [Clostridia bacterium]